MIECYYSCWLPLRAQKAEAAAAAAATAGAAATVAATTTTAAVGSVEVA